MERRKAECAMWLCWWSVCNTVCGNLSEIDIREMVNAAKHVVIWLEQTLWIAHVQALHFSYCTLPR